MSIGLTKAAAVVKAIQPKVKVRADGTEKIGVVKLTIAVEDGEKFLEEIGRGKMKLWPGGVGLVISVPQPQDGLRVTIKSGDHKAKLEMDGKLELAVLGDKNLSVGLTLMGHLTNEAVTSLWAIQVAGGATADVETMQVEIPAD